MKKPLLFILLLGAAPSIAQDLKALDEKNGFRDVKFNTPSSALQGAVLKEDSGDTKYYTRPTDELKIGNGALKQIAYGYYKDKLFSIVITTVGSTNSRAVFDALSANYGYGWRLNNRLDTYYWNAESARMIYEGNSLTGSARIDIENKAIIEQIDRDEKAAAQKAKSDL